MIKINKFIYIIIGLSTLLTSCKEEWLEPEPLSFFSPQNAYVNEDGFEAILVKMRKDIRREVSGGSGGYHFIAMEHSLSDLAISIFPSDLRIVTPSSGPVWPYLTMFDDVYGFIKNANVLISNIDNIEWADQSVKNRILAEALWHRAYWYYRLVHTYGDVPWVGQEIEGPKLDFQTYSRTAILNKIQEDLEWSGLHLPESPINAGDVPQGAAYHLLAKVYLANSNFDMAIASANKVIDGPYSLMTERFGIDAEDSKRNVQWDLHRWQNRNISANKETIYATIDRADGPIESRSGGVYSSRRYTPSYWKVLESTGQRAHNWSTPGSDTLGIGNADVRTNAFFHYSLWRDGDKNWETTTDLRRTDINWIEMEEILVNAPNSPQYGQPLSKEFYGNLTDTFDTWYPWPQYKTFVLSPNTRLPVGGEADWYIFRLAETYLLRAEAHYWKGDLAAAAEDINVVRDRSNASLISSSDVTIDFIFDERARELYMEEPRHNEMVRVSYIMAQGNINGYDMNSFSQSNWFYDRVMRVNNHYQDPNPPIWRGAIAYISPHNVLLPIPQSVIEANTQAVVNQNPGYVGAEDNVEPIQIIE
ncbi:RagB/SusD family nutrient uptake outer membrane protein [Membranihabitans marinus]|uniref:RagB/SusD family nutrient uptake outer membrane protein n=1 Tax=Membranihabitans marinus TaxID=1227546 RepID=UPI001F2EC030|nr:RagB/SusD family nutrient uptake outer membrane protein [Membranihabitans marinus]